MPIATPSTTSGALTLWRVPFATVITDEASEKRPLTLRKHATSYQTEPLNARALLLARLYRRDGSPMHYPLYDPFFVEGPPRA